MSDKLIEAVAKALVEANMAATKQVPIPGEVAYYVNSYKREARAVFAAIEASGYAVVPKEPTEAMTEAGYALDKYGDKWPADMDDIWKAMLVAAPKVTP